jgi:hypothetical protein
MVGRRHVGRTVGVKVTKRMNRQARRVSACGIRPEARLGGSGDVADDELRKRQVKTMCSVLLRE